MRPKGNRLYGVNWIELAPKKSNGGLVWWRWCIVGLHNNKKFSFIGEYPVKYLVLVSPL